LVPKGNSGKSYRNNRSRVYGKTKKHSEFTLHVIATIALDKKHPVQAFSISEDYTNGSVFEQFVSTRNLANHIEYDIIDRHGSHKAVQANINRGTIPVSEAYKECNIQEDFTPAGKPTFNPVELLFGYLGKYVADKAPKYNNGSGWTKENLKKILIEGKDSVTFDMVQSWYCRTFTEMFPDCEYPVYLRSNTSDSKFILESSLFLNG
jgi:transposase